MKSHPMLVGFVLGVAAVYLYHVALGPHLPGSPKG